MRKTGRNASAGFFEDKGFYIILFLCVAAIAISGYVLFFKPVAPSSELLDTGVYEPTVTPADLAPTLGGQQDIPVAPVPEPDPVPETIPAPQADTAATLPEEVSPVIAQPVAPVFVRPIAGEVTLPFSGDALVYQETFGDWRTHTGADYEAQPGSRVYAITDGTVEDVYQDALYGTCITLTHGDGLKTSYMGLSEKTKVKKGGSVKAGDVIGTVGTGNAAESAQGAHLHVEAWQNDKRVDPETLLTD